jgi:cephalosporin hydroxylase
LRERDEQAKLAVENGARAEQAARERDAQAKIAADRLAQAWQERDVQIKLAAERLEQLEQARAAAKTPAAISAEALSMPSLVDQSALINTVKEKILAELKPKQANPYIHNRSMTTALNQSLRDFFRVALKKEKLKPTYIDYLASKAIDIEKSCVGRLATTVQDAVVRQIVAESVGYRHLGILEIGSLFGVSLVILYNHCVSRFDSVKIIGLDPLEGFYGNAVDAVLNEPISPQTFHRNMQLGDVPADAYALIQKYSTDPTALEAARQEQITLLIIDGDHSYDGVKYDYDNYFPLLEPGGYVIFDDYTAKEWPDVQRFVDETVKNDPRCEFIGAFSRTAIGRKLPVRED